ncbi:MAG: hypothetical protein M5Z89_15705 [Olivibacter sp.]|uniref:hypothetical protein n=1 Tax=Olivibacter sp. 47 TaxID=3056486 RepID=UPI0025A3E0F6|nr:hypothetical protein [Olivibacter sp. 47]MCL4640441.1 hypothetical protein [Olivibacter sp. UJ_SKK_5.1]MDM8173691.1 hypothetical protein [Olivibacter sp. 47]
MEQTIGIDNQLTSQQSVRFLESHIGRSIHHFLKAFHSRGEQDTRKAFAILDDLPDLVLNTDNLNFLNGLAGIGWGLEWIVQNSFAPFNTDEILEDIDDELYKAVIYAPNENLDIQQGSLGTALYFQLRNSNINPKSNRYRQLCFQECLVLLTDDVRYKVDQQIMPNTGLTDSDVIRVAGQTLIVLSFLLPARINVHTIEKTLYRLIEWSESIIETGLRAGPENADHQSLHFLCSCAHTAAISLGYKRWTASFASLNSSLGFRQEHDLTRYTNLVYGGALPDYNHQPRVVEMVSSLTKAGRNTLNHILLIC